MKITKSLIEYIISEQYKGYDPYDVLNSPIFKLPILRNDKIIRFTAQQVFRRIPLNLRPLLGIKKEINPVTLGLCIQGYSYMLELDKENKNLYKREINYCLNKLLELSSRGYSGLCWGYNFDWEARYATIPKFTPTVVATGIITNSLYEYWKITGDSRIPDLLISSANFVLNDLNKVYEGDTFCFSYSPNDHQKVFNATMKGARLLSQVYSLTNNENFIIEAEKTVKFVCNNQNADGSWYYSKGDARKWIDNFHTAYILDALDEFIRISGKNEYKIHLEKGLNYYLNNLFNKEGIPKYYSHKFYPLDSTELAQSIITLTRFGYRDKAKIILNFVLQNFYNTRYFYYQINRFYIHKTPYMRWSTAYFFVALSFWLYKNKILF